MPRLNTKYIRIKLFIFTIIISRRRIYLIEVVAIHANKVGRPVSTLGLTIPDDSTPGFDGSLL